MELLERAPFLDQLDTLLHEAAAGQGRLVFLSGEAGVGKTVLIHHYCHSVADRAEVLVGACDPLSTPRPLGPLMDMAASVGGELERCLRNKEPRNDVFRIFLAGLGAGSKPKLTIFEDVHWADEATLDLLRYLGRRLAPTRTLLVATFRDDEIGPRHPLRVVMGDLATSPSLRRLTLPPLSVAAVCELAEGSSLDPIELHRQTGGNPFFVTEVLAAGSAGIPPTVRDAVLARAARLSPEARTALEACAIIGFRTEPWLLGEITGLAADAAEACVSLGMLRAAGEVLAFRHELAREAVQQSVSPSRKLVLHRSILKALTAAGSRDLSRLAHHAEGAGDRRAVLEYAPAAARQAVAVKAHRESAAQFARAISFADELLPLDRAVLLEAYAQECRITDRLDDAIKANREAIEIRHAMGDRAQESMDLGRLAPDLVVAGQNAAAEVAIETAASVLEGLPPGPELAFINMQWAYLRMLNRDNAEAIKGGRRAIELAQEFRDEPMLVRACNLVGSALILTGEYEPGRASLERSLQLALRNGYDNAAAGAYVNLGSAFGEMYRFSDADRYLGRGIDYCAERDIDSHRMYMQSWQALSHLYQGRWSDGTEAALSVTGLPGSAAISRIMALVALGRVRARRNDPDIWTVLDEGLALASQTATLQRLGPMHSARAEAAWLAGDVDKTRVEARAVYELALGHKHPWFVGELAYWRWKAGDLDRAPADAAAPFALQISGNWADAANEWQRLNCPYEAARALSESDDEGALRQALKDFEGLGARPAAAAVTRHLHELGVRQIPRGPRPSTRANPAGLTGRQIEVLRLMADGLSNADIAARLCRAPKTIDHHVSAVLAKLEVRSRTEAVREALRLRILGKNRESGTTN